MSAIKDALKKHVKKRKLGRGALRKGMGVITQAPRRGPKQVFPIRKKRQTKIATVMGEFGRGKLMSSSGRRVTGRKQAIAIALSEAGLSRKQKRTRIPK